jgi:hypothetical protein
MRISELLLEYRRDVTQQKLAKELDIIADNENTTPEDVLEQVENVDPTRNKQFVLWLVKQLVKRQFRLEDAPRVTELLNNFIAVKPRLPVEQRDIGRFDFYKLDDLIDKTLSTDMEQGRDDTGLAATPDTKVLYNGPLGQLAIPLTREASGALGKKTSWCTARDDDRNMFSTYNDKGPLYVWIDKDGKRYQFHFEAAQFMDSKDRPIDRDTLTYFRTRHPVLSKLFKRGEAKMLSGGDARAAAKYARSVVKGSWPEAEPTIMQDPTAAYEYATEVIGGRWPEAEPVIMTNPVAAVAYARHVIKGRWPEAEPTIKTSGDPARVYATEVIGGRWPEAEESIMTNSYSAFMYAKEILGRRWPEAEPIIATHKSWWRRYTKRFPDAGTNPTTSTKPKRKSVK